MSTYTTVTKVVFSNPESASKFVHFLDKAESEATSNDFGPGWLGNILSLFGCLNIGFCECNGVIINLEVVAPNIVELTTESLRGPQIGPVIFLSLLVDKTATISYISHDDDGHIQTNRRDLEGDHQGLNMFFPQNNLLSIVEQCRYHHID